MKLILYVLLSVVLPRFIAGSTGTMNIEALESPRHSGLP